MAHFIKDLGIALAEAKRMGAWLTAGLLPRWWRRHVSSAPRPHHIFASSAPSPLAYHHAPHHRHHRCPAGIALPGLALANQLYVAVQAQGHGLAGTQALYLALETLNGIKRA